MENHSRGHCRDEGNYAWRKRRQVLQGWPRTQPNEAPTDAEQCCSDRQLAIETRPGRPKALGSKKGLCAALDQDEPRDSDGQCGNHHDGQAWIPRAMISRKVKTFVGWTIPEINRPAPNINPQNKDAITGMV